MKDNGKNAYEIRADLLTLAKEALFDEYSFKQTQWAATVDRDSDGVALSAFGVQPPTVKDIVTAANQLYAFVNQNDRRESK